MTVPAPASLVFETCTPATYDEFLEFAAQCNSDRKTQYCLHVDETAVGIKNDLVQYEVDPFKTWFGARSTNSGKLLSVVGFEVNEASATGWIHGPWVSYDVADPNNVIRRWTFDQAVAALPVMNIIRTYYDMRSQDVLEALKVMGFTPADKMSFGMQMDAKDVRGVPCPALSPSAAAAAESFLVRQIKIDEKDDLAAVRALHGKTFKDPLHEFKEDSVIWNFGVYRKTPDSDATTPPPASALVGYACVRGQGDMPTCYIAFLGIEEAERGKGLGRLLLATIRKWFAEEETTQLDQMTLTVDADNLRAKGIYLETGFKEICTGVGPLGERDKLKPLTADEVAEAFKKAETL
ncbi:acyl-CoA N-acyltransferase [Fimicolochytrium jonesii]|uniref:acyl-CoA N-acyltransferase n=1 Tax=Fimicolochytrium jonesii TaxID=1396493 RepID=UPI0022FDD202|nr:acyl-CoA N-acyltransferase [Fimicolochytrium jonesii]KAI8825970.1 acyl-CoA N-acyltransferase [Fimicolochytrium jonesii]